MTHPLLQSLLTPAFAILGAQRALSLATLRNLRDRFTLLRGRRALAPILFEVTLPLPAGGQPLRFRVPKVSLAPSTQLCVGQGTVQWTWALERVIERRDGGTSPRADLHGREVSPVRRRPGATGLAIDIEMKLCRTAMPEGMRRLQDSLSRPRPRAGARP
jgi:hypothetical protein